MGHGPAVDVADTSSVLVLAPGGVFDTELLADATRDGGAVLLVAFTTPSARRDDIRAHVDADVVRVVAAGEETATGSGDGTLATVDRPEDLTELGIRVSEVLDTWQNREDAVVCFESLTPLLDRASLEEVFRFLHVLINRLDAGGATGIFHLDTEAHDPATVATLRPLFDRVHEQLDGELEMVRDLVDGYFGALSAEVSQSSPVSQSRLVTTLARLHRAARTRDLEDQDDVEEVYRGATEVVLAIPVDRWTELADDGLELRELQVARECHQRMATALGTSVGEMHDPFVYPF